MPWIIDYDIVTEQMLKQKLKCNYYNSGAFAFAAKTGVRHLAWIGPEDPTIRPEVRPLTRQAPPPYEANLARRLAGVWRKHFDGRIWAMPMSHWAYELEHGSREWMPALLENIGIDSGLLEGRNNAAAIEFSPDDARHLEHFAQRLLEMLMGSDFMFAFVGRPLLCTLHHHKQLWWSSTDDEAMGILEAAWTMPA